MYGKLFLIKVKGILVSQTSVYSQNIGNLEKKHEHHIILYYPIKYLYITNNLNLIYSEDGKLELVRWQYLINVMN